MAIKETVSANLHKLGRAEALALAARASEIIACKGKKVTRLRTGDGLSSKDILGALLGPTGNLRAPAAVVGKKLLVGFSPEVYAELFR